MAVPKKKVSHSRKRKRLLTGLKSKHRFYLKCASCLNFVKSHTLCPVCDTKGNPTRRINNINKLYDINF